MFQHQGAFLRESCHGLYCMIWILLSDLLADVLKLRLEGEVSSPTSILSTWLCGFKS